MMCRKSYLIINYEISSLLFKSEKTVHFYNCSVTIASLLFSEGGKNTREDKAGNSAD